jgi:hypothetical protein
MGPTPRLGIERFRLATLWWNRRVPPVDNRTTEQGRFGKPDAGVDGGQARLCRAGGAIKHSKRQGLCANLSTPQGST